LCFVEECFFCDVVVAFLFVEVRSFFVEVVFVLDKEVIFFDDDLDDDFVFESVVRLVLTCVDVDFVVVITAVVDTTVGLSNSNFDKIDLATA